VSLKLKLLSQSTGSNWRTIAISYNVGGVKRFLSVVTPWTPFARSLALALPSPSLCNYSTFRRGVGIFPASISIPVKPGGG
jgi:hypothetical protein